jgi:hypothetical protein
MDETCITCKNFDHYYKFYRLIFIIVDIYVILYEIALIRYHHSLFQVESQDQKECYDLSMLLDGITKLFYCLTKAPKADLHLKNVILVRITEKK